MCDYELERALRVESNKRRLAELVTARLAEPPPPPAKRPSAPRPPRKPLPPRELSARLRGVEAPNLRIDEHDRREGSYVGPSGEGGCKGGPGSRMCHCCRANTTSYKAQCTTCNSCWCVRCLRNKVGEDAHAANESGAWRCLRCVGGQAYCLCSMCRVAAGLRPLGAVWPLAQAAGHASVAAYLVALGERTELVLPKPHAEGTENAPPATQPADEALPAEAHSGEEGARDEDCGAHDE